MELKYLNTFKTILETGSFQKAAESLHYAQSTITLQMQLLEQELSVKLFEKIGRRMKLTQAGKEMLPYIDKVLEAVQQMEDYSQDQNEITGTLRIAMPESLLSYQMPKVLEKFHQKAPRVKLSLQAASCYEIREQIMNGSIELGIHYDIGGYGNSLVVETLDKYEFILVGGMELNSDEKDFMSGGQRKELCRLTDRSSLYNKKFDEYLRLSDIVFESEVELVSTEALKRLVISNLGVAYLPRFTVLEELEKGLVQELPTSIQDKWIRSVCTYHKNKWVTPGIALFIQLLREQADTPLFL